MARAMRAAEAARRGIAPTNAAGSAAPDVALGRLGIAAIDGAASEFGSPRFEPEFRGESPPVSGSSETDFTSFYIVRWTQETNVAQAAARLAALPDVASAEPIAWLPVAAIPNDSLFHESWWFEQPGARRDIHGPEAWDVTTGDTSIVVGVLDTGILPYHPDLGGSASGVGQIYTNPAPGVAGDGSGFVHDVHGWDFVDGVTGLPGEDVQDPDDDPNDFAGHGTAVAGVIGAISDNLIGVTGTAWNLRLMPLRIGWSAPGAALGLVDMSFVAQAIRYATLHGVNVINCSFATLDQSGLGAAARAATRAGVVIVAAAGNNGQSHDLAMRGDVIAVAATDSSDLITGFSNLGSFVTLAAPGQNILSTFLEQTVPDTAGADSVLLRQPAYVLISGTSFSAPMVTGAAALVQAYRKAQGLPLLDPMTMLLRMWDTSDDIAALNPGGGFGAGRLNVRRALTDRPTSTAAWCGCSTIGSPLLLPPRAGATPVAYLTLGRDLLLMKDQSRDTLGRLALPAIPLRFAAGGFAVRAAPGMEPGYAIFTGLANGKMAGMDPSPAMLPGWPIAAGGSFARPLGGPALGDLDGDGSLEVVCGIEDGRVMAWHPDGRLVPGFPVDASPAGVAAAVALADLDGDGAVEIVAAGADGQIDVFHGDGSEVLGWPQFVSGAPMAPVVTRFSRGGGPAIVIASGDTVFAFDPSGAPRFRAALTGHAVQDPALGDLTGDGVDEIVVALDSQELAVIDSSGVALPGTPIELTGGPQGPPLVGTFAPGGREALVMDGIGLGAFELDGTRLRTFPKPGGAGREPTLADLDSDLATEVVAGNGPDSMLYVYDAGAGTASQWVRGWPTERGDFARTGSRDIGPPSPVRDLQSFAVTDTSVELGWTSPGNEGAGFAPVRFEIHVGRDTLTPPTFDAAPAKSWDVITAAGQARRFVFGGLASRTRYVFALVAIDSAGNRSRVSNFVGATTAIGGPLTHHAGPAIAPGTRPSRAAVDLYWRGVGGAPQKIVIYDITGRRVRTLPLGAGVEGTENWNGRDDADRSVPAGLYFARLISGSVRVQTRVVLLP